MILSVQQAEDRILSAVSVLEPENRHISDSLGCVLAQDLYAQECLPPFRNSSMDGFAVMSKDVQLARIDQPVQLSVNEVIPAGNVPKLILQSGQAAKIMTGAMLPDGADSVVMVENTESISEYVKVFQSVNSLENVRLPGESVKTGDLVMPQGKLIRAQEVAMMAALNVQEILVFRLPTVAVISTGDELADLGSNLSPGKIRDSNRYGIMAQLQEMGCQSVDLGICGDKEKNIEETLLDGLLKADALITSGGVSVGEYDVVKSVLSRLGQINFWRVAMKPGKPQAFGLVDGKPIFGLPGNPVSSLTVFELFVRPALRKMAGFSALKRPIFQTTLNQDVVNNTDRVNYMRVLVEKREGEYYAKVTGPQGSGILYSLVLANGLVVIPANTRVKAGESVEMQFFEDAL